MSKIVKINKPIILKFEDKEINLPEDIKLNIEEFWNNAVKENPSLYNGKEFAVETVSETEEFIYMMKELESKKKNINVILHGEEY